MPRHAVKCNRYGFKSLLSRLKDGEQSLDVCDVGCPTRAESDYGMVVIILFRIFIYDFFGKRFQLLVFDDYKDLICR